MKEIQVEGKTVPLAVDKALKELAMRRDQVEVVILNEGSSGFLGIGARKACVVVRERKWTGARKERRPRPSFHREAKHQNHSREAQSKVRRAAPAARQSAIPEVTRKRQPVCHPAISGSGSSSPEAEGSRASGNIRKPQSLPNGEGSPAGDGGFAEGRGQSVVPAPKQTPGPALGQAETQLVMESAKSVVSQILNLSGIRFTELKAEWDSRQARVCVAFTSEPGSIFAEKDARALEALQFLVTLIVSRKNKTPVAVQVDTQDHWKKLEGEILEKINMAVETVKNTGHPYRFDPMSPAIRRFVHKVLEASTDVETVSEGESKWRKIVIKPRT